MRVSHVESGGRGIYIVAPLSSLPWVEELLEWDVLKLVLSRRQVNSGSWLTTVACKEVVCECLWEMFRQSVVLVGEGIAAPGLESKESIRPNLVTSENASKILLKLLLSTDENDRRKFSRIQEAVYQISLKKLEMRVSPSGLPEAMCVENMADGSCRYIPWQNCSPSFIQVVVLCTGYLLQNRGTVVFLHPFANMPSQWQKTASVFLSCSANVSTLLFVDCPGQAVGETASHVYKLYQPVNPGPYRLHSAQDLLSQALGSESALKRPMLDPVIDEMLMSGSMIVVSSPQLLDLMKLLQFALNRSLLDSISSFNYSGRRLRCDVVLARNLGHYRIAHKLGQVCKTPLAFLIDLQWGGVLESAPQESVPSEVAANLLRDLRVLAGADGSAKQELLSKYTTWATMEMKIGSEKRLRKLTELLAACGLTSLPSNTSVAELRSLCPQHRAFLVPEGGIAETSKLEMAVAVREVSAKLLLGSWQWHSDECGFLDIRCSREQGFLDQRPVSVPGLVGILGDARDFSSCRSERGSQSAYFSVSAQVRLARFGL